MTGSDGAGSGDGRLRDLLTLSDVELIELYQSKTAGDPDIDRIANAMADRGIDLAPPEL